MGGQQGQGKKSTFLSRLLGDTRDDDEYRALLMSTNPRDRTAGNLNYILSLILTLRTRPPMVVIVRHSPTALLGFIC